MKNIKFGKKQIILSALILSLGAAVYLNWKFASPREFVPEDSATSTKELGQAQFVNNTVDNAKPEKNNDLSQKNKEDATKDSEYFTKTRAERKKARNEATESIREILDDVKSSDAVKAEAVKKATEIAQKIEEEANIESLVKAKGFKDCIAFIQNDECSVVVNGQGLTEALATQIKDIVCSQGKIAIDKVKIIESA